MKQSMDIQSKLWRIKGVENIFSLITDCLSWVWDFKKKKKTKKLQFCSFQPSKPVPFSFTSIYSISSVSFSQRTVCFRVYPLAEIFLLLCSYLIWMLDEPYFPLLHMIFPLFSLNELFLESNLNPGQLLFSLASVCKSKS